MDPGVSSSSATSRAVQLFDVLDLIAKQLNNRKALYNACLVNRTFNDAFSKQLYRCLRWDRYSCRFLVNEEKRRTLLQNNNKLTFTRIFIITRSAVRWCMLDWDAWHYLDQPEWADMSSQDSFDEDSDLDPGPEVFRERRLGRRSVNWDEEDLPKWINDNEPDNWEYQFAVRGPVYDQLNAAIGDVCRHCPNLERFATQDVLLKLECLQLLSSLPSLGALTIEFPSHLRSFFGISYRRQRPRNIVKYVTRRSKYEHLSSHFSFSGLRKLSLLNIYQDLKAWRSCILEILVNSPGLESLGLSIEYGMVLESDNWELRDAEDSDQRVHRGLLTWISRQYHERTGRKLQPIVLGLGDGIVCSDDLYHDLETKRLGQIYIKNRSDTRPPSDDVSVYRIPAWLFQEEITPNLKRLSIFEINGDTSQVFESSTRSNASGFEIQADGFSLNESDEATKVRSLVYQTSNSLKTTKIMLPWLFSLEKTENSQVLGFENLSQVTDIAFSIDDYADIPTFTKTRLVHLKSLKNLWISAWIDEQPERSELFGYALQLAHSLPTLRYVKLTWQAWRIHRVPVGNDVDNVGLEALDKWEEEVEGPDFFYVPSPLPSFREDEHVDW